MKGILNTLEKRLYQLIISRLDGDEIHSLAYQEKILELIGKGVGGFIIFGGGRDRINAFVDMMQSAAEIPLFIASDIERGVGQQIKGYATFPSQMAVSGAIHRDRPEEVALLREVIKAIAHDALDVGINMPLLPVLDVNQNPDNPIICTRAFSDNPDDVSWFGTEYINILEDSGLISCAKHFPGHGDTAIDSHIALPTVSKSYRELRDTDLLPFIEAIRRGVSSLMVGHLQVSVLDSIPASLSKRVITDLLRKELGFEGLILTDALNMSSLSSIDNVATRCLDAGADLLLHPVDPDLTVKELISAVRSKAIEEGCIELAIGRIIEAKSWLRHISRAPSDYQDHRILSKEITGMSITLMKQSPGILPIADENNVQVLLAGEDKFFMPSLWATCFRNVSALSYQDDTGQDQGGKVVIVPIFSEVAAWKGSSSMGDEERERVIELVRKAKGSIVISFGSPYILGHFKGADILIAAYEANEQAQEAVIRCLKGEMRFRGHAPVTLSV